MSCSWKFLQDFGQRLLDPIEPIFDPAQPIFDSDEAGRVLGEHRGVLRLRVGDPHQSADV